jgi:hypothetical protein
MTSPAEEASESKSWREIAAGSQSNIQQTTRQVIQDPEQWREWWGKHNTVEILIDGKTVAEPPPKVDFTKETVLVATMGARSSGGFAIRFTGIDREGEVVTATLKTTSPGPDDMVTMALTAPFCIIAIPKHEGRVEFADEAPK